MNIIQNILISKIGHDAFDKEMVLSDCLDSLDVVDVVYNLKE